MSSLSPTAFESGLSLQSPTSLQSGRKRVLSAGSAEGKRMSLVTMLPGLSDLEPKVRSTSRIWTSVGCFVTTVIVAACLYLGPG